MPKRLKLEQYSAAHQAEINAQLNARKTFLESPQTWEDVKKYSASSPSVEIVLNETSPDSPLPHPESQSNKAATLECAISREEECIRRTTVRFIGYRVRPLDPDNFAGSVKDLLDGLRHADLIYGDEPWRIHLETEQVKVAKFSEEKTVIEIEEILP